MILRFCLRIADAREPPEEQLGRIGMDQRDVVVVAEQRDDFVRLARAHQPGVDEDAGELVADRFVDQHRGDGGIHAARQAADHLALADLLADLLDRGGAEGVHVPVGWMPAILRTKLAIICAPRGVCTTSGWNWMP